MALTTEPTPVIDGRAQIERILQSRIFHASEVLRNLLAYLSDKALTGTADSLKEYTIGLDALGKPESFDPRQESVVRMHTARLRQKLAEYYRTEGIDDPVIVDLPKGGFKITFESRPQAVVPPPAPPTPAPLPVELLPARRGWHPREIALAAGLLVTLGCAVYFMTQLWRVERVDSGSSISENFLQQTWTPALRELWDPLLSSSRRLVVCVATPLFVNVPGFGVVRESSVNDWDDASTSKRLSSVESALQAGMSEPSYSYTEAGTATGAFLLGQFLAPRKQAVLITRANVLSWPELAEDNVVFLGPTTGIHQADDIPTNAQLVLDPTGIRNLHPRTGESAIIADHPAQGGEEGGVSLCADQPCACDEWPGRDPHAFGQSDIERYGRGEGVHDSPPGGDAGIEIENRFGKYSEVFPGRPAREGDGRRAGRYLLRFPPRSRQAITGQRRRPNGANVAIRRTNSAVAASHSVYTL